MSKLAVITGAAGGIGQATAELFAASGWRVIGLDRQPTTNVPAGVDAHQVDVADPDQVEFFFSGLKKSDSRLDVLVNNAAVAHDKPLAETTLEEWDSVLQVNLRSAYLMIRQGLDLLLAAGGSIVNVASVHALATATNVTAYAASKGGLAAMTRALALELGPQGVRVNSVLPGAIDTPMFRQGLMRDTTDSEDAGAKRIALARRTPLRRVGQTIEVAEAILFLADADRSSFITGHGLVVDGGATARLGTE